jgi:regulator of PEP synthase PpsR (kinase-PPPase family)
MNSLKETENIKYTNIENIKKEIEDAKKTFQKYNGHQLMLQENLLKKQLHQ